MKQLISQLALDIIAREHSEKTGQLIFSDCGLTDWPEEIFSMDWLESLIITNGRNDNIKSSDTGTGTSEHNHLTYIHEGISELKNLKSLELGRVSTSPWSIRDIHPLAALGGLQHLKLPNIEITDISSLSKLNRLQTLDLGYNKISDISPISNLTNLTFLDMTDNKITDITPLSGLNELQDLYVDSNSIKDIASLAQLHKMQSLSLKDNEITDISPLSNLNKLERLFLYRNDISDITPINKLINLTFLDLIENKIFDITPLKKLNQLVELFITGNQISDITTLAGLPKLELLMISVNQIENIQPLTEIPKLKTLTIDNNPIKDCPTDVWETEDIKQIRAYFDSLKREAAQKKKKSINKSPVKKKTARKSLQEATQETEIHPEVDDVKLIFVGNSGVGKTQLSQYMESGILDDSRETTRGIRLNRWFPTKENSEAFGDLEGTTAVNMWDFGGQEYYHGTFRLFLNNYAVYVLLWEQETNQDAVISTDIGSKKSEDLQHYHYQYWLDNIRHYAPDSPVLIVQNKVDRDKVGRVRSKWIDEYEIYGDHYISLHATAAETGAPHYKWSYDLFCKQLYDALEKVKPTLEKESTWMEIRDLVVELLEQSTAEAKNPFKQHLKNGNYIDIKDFENACRKIEPKLTEDELYALPRWLNNSGTVIYFGDVDELKTKVYLDPIWITEGIYEILSETIRAKHGEFSIKDIEERKDISRDTLIALMEKMEIIFKKPNSDIYIAPQYLPETHPVEDLYSFAAKGLQQNSYYVKLPRFFYRKVLQRMIFFYGHSENVSSRYYWKHGILFEKDQTRVMFKGIKPEPGGETGVLVISAADEGNAYAKIRGEVFQAILTILSAKGMENIGSPNQADTPENQSAYNPAGAEYDQYLGTDGEPPRWLKQIAVSVNGTDFVSYLDLCDANRRGAITIQATQDQLNGEDKQVDRNKANRKRKSVGEREQANAGKHAGQSKPVYINRFEFLLGKTQRPLKIFVSYSHKDTEMMNRLSAHLAPLRRSEKIEVWTDKAIQAGEKWDASIDENLRDSSVVLLLLSADFVASSYIWEKEIPMAEELKKNTNAKIIPIYIRPFDFSKLSFSDSEMIPKRQDTQALTAISEWGNMDGAFKVVAEAIREVIEKI